MNYSLHFRADSETRELLERLASTFACSKGEVARRALKFFHRVYTEKKHGNDVIIRNCKEMKDESMI